MKLLGIDASTEMVSLACVVDGKVVFTVNRRRKHGASHIAGYLADALRSLSCRPSFFDAFVVGAGPGSFTGLRISFGIVKGLSLACDKPIVVVGSFFVPAFKLRQRYSRMAVISDARRNQVYAAAFRSTATGIFCESKENLWDLRAFVRAHKKHVFMTHDENLRRHVMGLSTSLVVHPQNTWPSAQGLIALVRAGYGKKYRAGTRKLEPLYVYPDDCQVRKTQV